MTPATSTHLRHLTRSEPGYPMAANALAGREVALRNGHVYLTTDLGEQTEHLRG